MTEIAPWLHNTIGEGLAANTVHNHSVALLKVFRYAERHWPIGHNQCGAVALPKNTRDEDFSTHFHTAMHVDIL